ncbi:MAG TPA: thioredoxin domain-containing protein [Vicinamibacterales bacterium]|jgi:protein-disulfide isomerase|nr:thioredoxin domain-containing protein [Vicinamibacterales bacterium]
MTTSGEAPALSPPVGARDHAQGPASAPLTLVEYGDFECPHCGRAHPVVKGVQKHFGARLRFVFRNFPMATIHPHAERAAEAAEAAASHGRFWEMHDTLFEHQGALDDRHLETYAEAIGLDRERFLRELRDGAHAGRVREDFLGGIRSGVNGTPTFFINGRRHDASWDAATLTAALEAELAPR